MIKQMGKSYQHRLSSHPLYHTWENMRQRCYNSKHTAYKWYGARGIKICERWNNFANFVADVGEKPPGTTLDRKDNNGDYEPDNVRWADQVEQIRNSRIRETNRTGTKGVWFNRKVGTYQAFIRAEGRRIYLGSFPSLDKAVKARKKAEKELW